MRCREAVLRPAMASLRELPRLMEQVSLEKRKEFVRAFVEGITVHPEERRLEVRIRKIPAAMLPRPGSSVGMVAGARFEPLQKHLVVRSLVLDEHAVVAARAA